MVGDHPRDFFPYPHGAQDAINAAAWEAQTAGQFGPQHPLVDPGFPGPLAHAESGYETPRTAIEHAPLSPLEAGAHLLSQDYLTGALGAQGQQLPATTQAGAYSLDHPAGMNDELINAAIEEDKRRRNTAASARFRTKKKEREAELERSTRDINERCEGLQKRIGELETENRWLRELITERSRNRGRRGGGTAAASGGRREKSSDTEKATISIRRK